MAKLQSLSINDNEVTDYVVGGGYLTAGRIESGIQV